MSRSRFLAIVVVIVAVVVAAPRSAPQSPEPRPVQGSGRTAGTQSGAPPSMRKLAGSPGENSAMPVVSPTPRPSGAIGEPASYCKPQFCETPQPRIVDGISGEATWWYSFGGGFYVALRPDLGSKGDLVIVCGGAPFHCRTAPVITSCACLGPNSDRLVDLSRDLFAEFADPDRGVVRVVIQVIKGGTS